jgi:hypothetical protein
MNKLLWILPLAFVAAGPAQAEPAALPGWLVGCWEQVEGDKWTDECWTTPRGGIQIGSGRSGRGEKLNSWESMQIERGEDGGLTFYGSPGGAPRVAFPLVSQAAQEVVFANPAHDYPQRIRYWRDGELLRAEIALADGSKAVGLTYRRDQ